MSSSRSAARRTAASNRTHSNGAGPKQQPQAAQRAPVRRVVDWPAAVRGTSRAFTILVLGGIVAPLVGRFLAGGPLNLLNVYWLPIIAVVGYFVGGLYVGTAAAAWLQGIVAALGAWLLTLPIFLLAEGLAHADALGIDAGIAVVAGAVGGLAGACRRSRRGNEQTS